MMGVFLFYCKSLYRVPLGWDIEIGFECFLGFCSDLILVYLDLVGCVGNFFVCMNIYSILVWENILVLEIEIDRVLRE